MFRIGTSSRHASAVEDQGETVHGDGASTKSGETSQTLLLCRNRRGLRRRRIAIRPKTVEKDIPILNLKEKDQVRIRRYIQEVFQDSKLPNRVDDASRYDSTTIVRGSLLGEGTFSSVYKIRSGMLPIKSRRSKETLPRKESYKFERCRNGTTEMISLRNPWQSRLRKIYSSLRFGTLTPKYAIKTINKDALRKDLLVWSAAYLEAETRMLSGIDHPHIIRFCGWGSSSSHLHIFEGTGIKEDETPRLQYGHFLIIERLEIILKKQLKEWELERRKIAGCFLAGKRYPDEAKIVGATSVNHKYRRNRQINYLNRMYTERLGVALQLSSAIVYLHERNILHRDIKPQNIGFDVEGNVKLFDFGISKEIIQSKKSTGDEVNERLYNLTGVAGSRSYMSPENGLCQPYNAKTDVYSFSMVLWELMTLRKLPHRRYSNSQLEEQVWLGPDNERPPLMISDEGNISDNLICDNTILLELPIRNLLEQCWSPMVHKRPTMKSVHQVLQKHLLEVCHFTNIKWNQQ